MNKGEKVPIAYCEICETKNPIHISTLEKKVDDGRTLKAEIGWCAVCETVLNLEEDKTIEWVGEEWLDENGWKEFEDKDDPEELENETS